MPSQSLRANKRSNQSTITWSVIRGSSHNRSAKLPTCERPKLPAGRLMPRRGPFLRYSPYKKLPSGKCCLWVAARARFTKCGGGFKPACLAS